jgi:hypothetical protein
MIEPLRLYIDPGIAAYLGERHFNRPLMQRMDRLWRTMNPEDIPRALHLIGGMSEEGNHYLSIYETPIDRKCHLVLASRIDLIPASSDDIRTSSILKHVLVEAFQRYLEDRPFPQGEGSDS